MSTQPVGQLFEEYRAFSKDAFVPGDQVFYDGEMDPLKRWSAQEQAALGDEIDAAGGLEAWKALPAAPIKRAA
jgi:hypothetical protein